MSDYISFSLSPSSVETQMPESGSWWYLPGEKPECGETTNNADEVDQISNAGQNVVPAFDDWDEVPIAVQSVSDEPEPDVVVLKKTIDRPFRDLVQQIYMALLVEKGAILAFASSLGANASRGRFSSDKEFGNLPEFLWKATCYFFEREQKLSIPELKSELFKVEQELASLVNTLDNMDVDAQSEKALILIDRAETLATRKDEISARIKKAEDFGKNRKAKTSLYDKIKRARDIIKGENGDALATEFSTVYREKHFVPTKHTNANKTKIVRTVPVVAAPIVVPVISEVVTTVVAPAVPVATVDPMAPAVPVAPVVPMAPKKPNALAALMGKKVGKK